MFLYNIAIRIYFFHIRLASLWSKKAKLWVDGRKEWKTQLESSQWKERPIWIHVSSLGEFEQVRHFIETVKKQFPQTPIVLTFFSPSGFEIRKDYPHVDQVLYIPRDTKSNAHYFLKTLNPRCVLFVKYDLWFNFIKECQSREIPLLLISAIFKPSQYFFKPWGKPFKKILQDFDKIFVQDHDSQSFLVQQGFNNSQIAGDTRIDRAFEIMTNVQPHQSIQTFAEGRNILICGSNWPEDDEILIPLIEHLDKTWKIVLAPHDVSQPSLDRLTNRLIPDSYTFFSTYHETNTDCSIMILDSIGHLSSAYKIGHIAYIGGGFKKGIHNTLEPAAAGIPIIFGPNFASFKEAVMFVERGLAFSVKESKQLITLFELIKDKAMSKGFAPLANDFLEKESGATKMIISELKERKILK